MDQSQRQSQASLPGHEYDNKSFETSEPKEEDQTKSPSETYQRLVENRTSQYVPDEEIDPMTAFPADNSRFSTISTITAPITQGLVIPTENGKKVIIVLGSGDFGRALSIQLTHAGYYVIIASRNPQQSSYRLEKTGAVVMSQAEGLSKSSVVFVTVSPQHYSQLPVPALQNKLLIDVSNKTLSPQNSNPSWSNAESLQLLVPSSVVVKGFNTLSAYALERGLHFGRQVSLCCDLEWPVTMVSDIARSLALIPVYNGPLSKSIQLESEGLRFFPEWRTGVIYSLVVFAIFWINNFFRRMICNNIGMDNWDWRGGFNSVMLCGGPLGGTAITLLGSTYLPGVVAAYVQLFRGTKYTDFPKWLDSWLNSRKYIGICALFFAFMHAAAELLSSSMIWQSSGLRQGSLEGNYEIFKDTTPFPWQNATYLMFGIMSLLLFSILGITSLPSVASALSWREFINVQSKLGWVTLVFATFHLIATSWSSILKNHFECYVLFPTSQLSLIIPAVTIVLKVPLILPCIGYPLDQIRKGFDRKKNIPASQLI